MIYKHQYLSETFLNNKRIFKVNKQKPLVVILSKNFTFLNNLILTCLRYNEVSFKVNYTDQSEVMYYQLPAIAFDNYFLSQQALIQFIADLMLQKQSFSNMTERKQIAKEQYKKWFTIIKQQSEGLYSYSSLKNIGVITQQDYHNHLFSQFFQLASWFKSPALQTKYITYKKNQINLQNMFVHEVVKSILMLCPKTKVDHILRAHFEHLIEFQESFSNQIKNFQQKEVYFNKHQIQIVTDKNLQKPIEQYPNLKINAKKFIIAFAIVAGVYAQWVQ